MTEIKELGLGTITETSKYCLFTFADGRVAIDSDDRIAAQVVLNINKNDTVYFITITTGDYSVSFFKVNDLYRPINPNSQPVTLNREIEFCDIIAYDEKRGYFIKCKLGTLYGILCIDEDYIIDISDGYTDIEYKEGVFYAFLENDPSKYKVIDKYGEVDYASDTRYQKVDCFSVYFWENEVICYVDSYFNAERHIFKDNMPSYVVDGPKCLKFTTKEKIISAQVLGNNCYEEWYNTIKIITEKGNEYYSLCANLTFELIHSSRKDDKIDYFCRNVIISEYVEGNCVNKTVFSIHGYNINYEQTLGCKSKIEDLGRYTTYYTTYYKAPMQEVSAYFVVVDGKCLYVISSDDSKSDSKSGFKKVYESSDDRFVNRFKMYNASEYRDDFEHFIIGLNENNISVVVLVYDCKKGEIIKERIDSTSVLDINFTCYSLKRTKICIKNSDNSVAFVVTDCVKLYKSSAIWGEYGIEEEAFIAEKGNGGVQVIPISKL